MCGFLNGCQGQDSGPHIYTASTPPTEPPPHLVGHFGIHAGALSFFLGHAGLAMAMFLACFPTFSWSPDFSSASFVVILSFPAFLQAPSSMLICSLLCYFQLILHFWEMFSYMCSYFPSPLASTPNSNSVFFFNHFMSHFLMSLTVFETGHYHFHLTCRDIYLACFHYLMLFLSFSWYSLLISVILYPFLFGIHFPEH